MALPWKVMSKLVVAERPRPSHGASVPSQAVTVIRAVTGSVAVNKIARQLPVTSTCTMGESLWASIHTWSVLLSVTPTKTGAIWRLTEPVSQPLLPLPEESTTLMPDSSLSRQ